jgi:hypothetical protein
MTNVSNKELHPSLQVKFSKKIILIGWDSGTAQSRKGRLAAGSNARGRDKAWGARRLAVRRPMDSRVRGTDSLLISKQRNKITN